MWGGVQVLIGLLGQQGSIRLGQGLIGKLGWNQGCWLEVDNSDLLSVEDTTKSVRVFQGERGCGASNQESWKMVEKQEDEARRDFFFS